jgi:sulfatase modifying factor 1
MIAISKGSFLMGSDTGSDAEKPIHLIHLDEFYLDECLVSNKDFSEFVDDTGYVTGAESSPKTGPTWRTYSTEDRKDHPVIMVSWHDANQYSRWCGKSLPTEAQWERAARAGRHADLFPWGDQAPQTELAHWIQTLRKDEMPPTAPVTRSKPNAYGLYDMAGNVWQWCGDWYGRPSACAARIAAQCPRMAVGRI